MDISRGMLYQLQQKLPAKRLSAQLVRADVQTLPFKQRFELAILPFQSFMELIGQLKQAHCLQSVYCSLLPGGTFFCTLHNPLLRRRSVDGELHVLGRFRH